MGEIGFLLAGLVFVTGLVLVLGRALNDGDDRDA